MFLYSLLFFGVGSPYIAFICLLATIPFTGVAWILGAAAVSVFKNNAAYQPAAWLAVFLEAYIVLLLFRARKIANAKKKRPNISINRD